MAEALLSSLAEKIISVVSLHVFSAYAVSHYQ